MAGAIAEYQHKLPNMFLPAVNSQIRIGSSPFHPPIQFNYTNINMVQFSRSTCKTTAFYIIYCCCHFFCLFFGDFSRASVHKNNYILDPRSLTSFNKMLPIHF